MSSIIGFGNVVLVLGLAQLLRWAVRREPRTPFRIWIGTSQAWGGWAIFAAVAIYMSTLLAVVVVQGM
ncbi:MAG: hypothetical protein AB7I38_15300 [Dehalococcoidia bacterium]